MCSSDILRLKLVNIRTDRTENKKNKKKKKRKMANFFHAKNRKKMFFTRTDKNAQKMKDKSVPSVQNARESLKDNHN